MKRAIITPTYIGHFKYIKRYLESFQRYVVDKDEVTLVFTISKNEIREFESVVAPYKATCKIEVLIFEDILRYYNIPYSCDQLLFKYKKFSYQTMKKFYTMLYTDYDQMLVLDSESMFVKETNISKLFIGFFSTPYITVCDNKTLPFVGNFKKGVIYNFNLILGTNEDVWFLENFVWFYDKRILRDLFNLYGMPIEIIDRIFLETREDYKEPGCFEICLYQAFVYKYHKNYNYTIYKVQDLLKKYLCDDYEVYIKTHLDTLHGEFGLLEMTMVLLDEKNCLPLASLFADTKFNIIRCDHTNYQNYRLQKKFLALVQPNILAASQNHLWGINDTFSCKFKMLMFTNNIFARYVYYDLKFILYPLIWILQVIKRCGYIAKHTLEWFILFVKNIDLFYKDK